jgi:hypothetical protein
MTQLGLNTSDIDLLFTAFWDIDADNSGTGVVLISLSLLNRFFLSKGLIRPEELFAYFSVEGTPFERRLFALFDEGKISNLYCANW